MVSQQRLWVAKKRGMPVGYGDTPEKAVLHAIKWKHKVQEAARISLSRDEMFLNDIGKLSELLKTKDRVIWMKDQQLKNFSKEMPTDSWVLMSCAFLQTQDPHAAIKEMYRRGAIPGPGETEAADRIAELMAHWKGSGI